MADGLPRGWWLPDWVEPPVVVGCSGGADSLALLVLAARAGLRPLAVYVDHGLRSGTVAEADLVATVAAGLGAESRAVSVSVETGPGLEARAREARHRALGEQRRVHHASAVLLGHTADDQAETVLLNLLRGAGTTGLGGMAPEHGRVVRPLLALRRSDTVEICARARLRPVDDPMNADPAFRRVWLRRELIPWLETVADRDLRDVLARQAGVIREDSDVLDGLADEVLADAGAGPAPTPLPLRALEGPRSLRRRVVRRWLGPPWPSAEHVDGVLGLERGAAAAELPGGRRIERAGGALHLIAEERAVPPADPVAVRLPGVTTAGRYRLETWIERAPPVTWPDGRLACVLDADRVGPEAIVRSARPGERVAVLGLAGTKKVTDVLGDAGVPPSRRSAAPLLCDPVGTPLWVLGYRVGATARVTTSTRRYLWATVENLQSRSEGLTS